jgi:hypothetical protein
MSELRRLQQDMMAWLLKKDEAIKPAIVDTGEVNKVSVEQRLAVYGNAYRFRLIDALSDTFPSVHTLMGDEAFYDMSLAYIDAYPSHYFTLRNFGDKLVGFLRDYNKEAPVLAEMAEFEWMLRNSFDSADIEAISLQDLQAIPAENWGAIRFTFHPSVARLDLYWNTPQLWAAIDEEAEPIAPEKLENPIGWVLSRRELLTYYRSLDVDEAWALDQALDGNSFAGLCEGVCEWIDEQHAPARIAGFVAQWIDEGLIIGIDE